MFISIEKACELTGRSKNALYRLMSQDKINFVRCTKGKRYLEVAELRRVYGQLNGQASEPIPPAAGDQNYTINEELFTVVSLLRSEVQALSDKVEQQLGLIEQMTHKGVMVEQVVTHANSANSVPTATAASPEQDPEWPPFITRYSDLAKRDEIKAKYEFIAKYGK